ncbi:hypothetical protein F4561_005232 [Lipingzhangella halophila]|uniref:Uncharacterized protein n=1 Tax=Lipingzhangella halophila TaxID=1783352 RepID=A0A7W7RLY1_9ACTN|nr:hypothetical protein [Lipingzhangella halophila]MBB4934412.1 hypothetical protein [Lipingzhangella halophila]
MVGRIGERVSVALLVFLVSSCSSETSEPSTPEDPPTASATESDDPAAEAITAYEHMWDVVVEASRDASPDHSDLDQYASGQAAALMRQGMEGVEEPLVGEPVHDIEVRSSDSSEVEIRDCMDASEWVEEGEPPSDDVDIRVDATISKDALNWLVTDTRIWEPGTC